jgi:hypothetical protein
MFSGPLYGSAFKMILLAARGTVLMNPSSLVLARAHFPRMAAAAGAV